MEVLLRPPSSVLSIERQLSLGTHGPAHHRERQASLNRSTHARADQYRRLLAAVSRCHLSTPFEGKHEMLDHRTALFDTALAAIASVTEGLLWPEHAAIWHPGPAWSMARVMTCSWFLCGARLFTRTQ